jgi:hypothetical protein
MKPTFSTAPNLTNCDFWGAPIGKKWCHYDRTVEDHQVPALITSDDTNTHRPVWSDDSGKTWHWNDGLDGAAIFTPHPAETHVYVDWTKVEGVIAGLRPPERIRFGMRLIMPSS